MALTTIYFCSAGLTLWATLRMVRLVREAKQKRADARLKSHLNWTQPYNSRYRRA